MASGRFAIATHALAVLSRHEDGLTSELVASSVNTNPAFLRRLMSSLCQAGLVEAREGRGGGYRLTRSPERIRLRDVYEAVEPEGAIGASACEPSSTCPVGAGMREAFAEAARSANAALLGGLSGTVADIARRAEKLGKKHQKEREKRWVART